MFSITKMGCLAALLAGMPAMAANINIGSYTLLSGADVVTFNDVPAHFDLNDPSTIGTVHDAIVITGGVAFGEHFAGQVVGASGNFDVVSGVPSGPLALVAGATNENLYAVPSRVIDLPTNQFDVVLAGMGQQATTGAAGVGEGAISLLFSSDQSQFGIQLIRLDGGNTYFSFFRGDGSLIQTLSVKVADKSYVGFFRDGQVKDIRGVSIWNDDPAGMAIDNLKHDVASNVSAVPEPGTLVSLLAGLGLLGAVGARRKNGKAA